MPSGKKLAELERQCAVAANEHVNHIEFYGDAVEATKQHRSPENVSKMLTRETELLASAMTLYKAMKAERRAKKEKKK